jgi:putative membrane protein insertion efficiency factor
LKPITALPSGAGFARPDPDPLAHPGPVAWLVLGGLRVYKFLLSPLFAGSCRFTPSCSDYMAEAVRHHGAGTGVWLGLKRLARCHPFGSSGVDPVPPVRPRRVKVQ